MSVCLFEFLSTQVPLRSVGEYLGLVVPGLGEGQPSVLIGDKVMLFDPSDPKAPVHEGFVHEVKENDMYIHDMYIIHSFVILFFLCTISFNSVKPENYKTELFFSGISEDTV